MRRQKFYEGDNVWLMLKSNRHNGHLGKVANCALTKTGAGVNYSVDCACGQTVNTLSTYIMHSSKGGDTRSRRLRHLFKVVGRPCPKKDELEPAAKAMLSVLQRHHNQIVQLRFGLIPGPYIYREIGYLLNIRAQSVHRSMVKAIDRMKRMSVRRKGVGNGRKRAT